MIDRRKSGHFALAVSVAMFLVASHGEGQPAAKTCAEPILLKCRQEPGPAPIGCVFTQNPSFSFPMMGLFATGMALVDINGDGWDDLVMASGNDMAPQPLTVFYNTGVQDPVFPQYPSWYSDQIGYMLDLAVGDVNGDGWMDVAVAVGTDLTRNTGTGSVQVFFNRSGQLEPRASYRTGGGYLVTGCELGDVDADGDLDLIVPVVLEGVAQFPPQPDLTRPGRARIYVNEDGSLKPWPDWISEKGIKAADAIAADINQDGWMDIAFAGTQTEIFYGRRPDGSSRIPIPTTPGWASTEKHQFSFALDAGYDGPQVVSPTVPVPSRQPLMLAVSAGCFGSFCSPPSSPEALSRFLLYRPQGEAGESSVWGSDPAQSASKLLLADFNGDGFLDLAGDQWGPVDMTGASTWLFQGRPDPIGRTTFMPKPDFATQYCTVGEGLAASDLRHLGVRSWCQELEATEPVSVLTLPQRKILGIDRIRRSGETLASFEYAWVPGSNWISLARPLEKGEKVSVKYRISPVMDFVQGVWQPQLGSTVYLSFLIPDSSKGNCTD
jgi:hypothetical protein